jgi:hypothetical protein
MGPSKSATPKTNLGVRGASAAPLPPRALGADPQPPRKRGRPPLGPTARILQLNLRVTQGELDQLRKLAATIGLPVGVMVMLPWRRNVLQTPEAVAGRDAAARLLPLDAAGLSLAVSSDQLLKRTVDGMLARGKRKLLLSDVAELDKMKLTKHEKRIAAMFGPDGQPTTKPGEILRAIMEARADVERALKGGAK